MIGNIDIKPVLYGLKKAGIFASSIEILAQGRNSLVVKLSDDNGKHYSLKFYKPANQFDPRPRQKSESIFLSYAKLCDLKNVPILLHEEQKENWSLLGWLEGCHPKTIDTQKINQIVEFMQKINAPEGRLEAKRMGICIASEAYINAVEAAKSILNKALNISWENHQEDDHYTAKTRKLFEECLLPKIRSEADILANKKDEQHWKDDSLCAIISPSDVGIHNTIENNGNLYFLDFEYAGFDDLSKFYADWTMQPNYIFSEEQKKIFKQFLCTEVSKNNCSWVKRYRDIAKINHLKWCVLMIKGKTKGDDPEENYKRIHNYYKQGENIS